MAMANCWIDEQKCKEGIKALEYYHYEQDKTAIVKTLLLTIGQVMVVMLFVIWLLRLKKQLHQNHINDKIMAVMGGWLNKLLIVEMTK